MKILIATLRFRSLSSSVMERGRSACWIPFPMSFHRPRVDDSKRNRRMGRNTRTSSGGFLLGGKFNPPSLSLRLNVYLFETGVFSRWKCANPLFRGYRETCRCCRFALIIREGEEVGWKACFFPLIAERSRGETLIETLESKERANVVSECIHNGQSG